MYKIFYEVAKCGSISSASKKLYVSQPAVSSSIKNLEDKLNESLTDEASTNTMLDNGRESYKFKLFLDAGDYIGYDYYTDTHR